PNNRIARLVTAEKDDRKVVEGLFLAILCRPPTDQEMAEGLKALQGNKDEHARLLEEHQKRGAAVAAYENELPARQAEGEKGLKAVTPWTVLEPLSAVSKGGAVLTKQADNSLLASGKNPSPEVYTVTANTRLTGITGVRLEVLPDPSLAAQGPGRAPNGNF